MGHATRSEFWTRSGQTGQHEREEVCLTRGISDLSVLWFGPDLATGVSRDESTTYNLEKVKAIDLDALIIDNHFGPYLPF